MVFTRIVCHNVGENHAHRACTMHALYLIREVTAFHQNKPDVDRLSCCRARSFSVTENGWERMGLSSPLPVSAAACVMWSQLPESQHVIGSLGWFGKKTEKNPGSVHRPLWGRSVTQHVDDTVRYCECFRQCKWMEWRQTMCFWSDCKHGVDFQKNFDRPEINVYKYVFLMRSYPYVLGKQ